MLYTQTSCRLCKLALRLTAKPNFDGMADGEAQALLDDVIPKNKFDFPVIEGTPTIREDMAHVAKGGTDLLEASRPECALLHPCLNGTTVKPLRYRLEQATT